MLQLKTIFCKNISPRGQGERHIPLKSPNIIIQVAERVSEGVGGDPDSFTAGILQL